MPQQLISSVENNFTKGLVTEFTGLNFPENAATDCDNVEFTIIGDVLRRLGIDGEQGYGTTLLDRTGRAINTYKWDNAGGDGSTQVIVVQVGATLVFYKSSAATLGTPISNQYLTQIALSASTNGVMDETKNCEFATGNGYLFVFHPNAEPAYCTFNSANPALTSVSLFYINVQIRDMGGFPEYPYITDDTRPSSSIASNSHVYNLLNQGWTSGNPWSASSVSGVTTGTGAKAFTVAAGITGVSAGQNVQISGYVPIGMSGNNFLVVTMNGVVASYVGTTLTITVTSVTGTAGTYSIWSIIPIATSYLGTWVGALGNYPSNADQWWRFKNSSGVFDPATTIGNVTIGGPAPKGHILLNAFTQYRSAQSGQDGVADIVTPRRPSNGCWFQGRLWMTGVNGSQVSGVVSPFYTWSENIYFSQVIFKTDDFGKCYQVNDPTSEELFDLLPTDGGVIVIPGSGAIYKLFPLQNGLLVFAANGVWFITGSQGIGFAANDYVVTFLSSIKSISSTSFVDVQGLPYFWNEEGIYHVKPKDGGGLEVASITFDTIASFYEEIPLEAKKFARGAYDPINYVIQWVYKSENSTGVEDKFAYDRILNYNIYNKAFYPYSIDNNPAAICGIVYVSGPGGSNTLPSKFKYWTSSSPGLTFFAEAKDNTYVDWASQSSAAFESYFITGYKLHGKAQTRFQVPYIYVYNRMNDVENSYYVQALWDYANSEQSNRWSTPQYITINSPNFSVVERRPRIRGRGLALQLKFTSAAGKPFDIIGWSSYEAVNQGV